MQLLEVGVGQRVIRGIAPEAAIIYNQEVRSMDRPTYMTYRLEQANCGSDDLPIGLYTIDLFDRSIR